MAKLYQSSRKRKVVKKVKQVKLGKERSKFIQRCQQQQILQVPYQSPSDIKHTIFEVEQKQQIKMAHIPIPRKISEIVATEVDDISEDGLLLLIREQYEQSNVDRAAELAADTPPTSLYLTDTHTLLSAATEPLKVTKGKRGRKPKSLSHVPTELNFTQESPSHEYDSNRSVAASEPHKVTEDKQGMKPKSLSNVPVSSAIVQENPTKYEENTKDAENKYIKIADINSIKFKNVIGSVNIAETQQYLQCHDCNRWRKCLESNCFEYHSYWNCTMQTWLSESKAQCGYKEENDYYRIQYEQSVALGKNAILNNVGCNECSRSVEQFHYACLECHDYDICPRCYDSKVYMDSNHSTHKDTHLLIKLDNTLTCTICEPEIQREVRILRSLTEYGQNFQAVANDLNIPYTDIKPMLARLEDYRWKMYGEVDDDFYATTYGDKCDRKDSDSSDACSAYSPINLHKCFEDEGVSNGSEYELCLTNSESDVTVSPLDILCDMTYDSAVNASRFV